MDSYRDSIAQLFSRDLRPILKLMLCFVAAHRWIRVSYIILGIYTMTFITSMYTRFSFISTQYPEKSSSLFINCKYLYASRATDYE